MPTLDIVNFNIVCATLGGFITVFGLVSYLLKEKFYLSEALISTLAGLVFSPHATNFIKPLQYANYNEVHLEMINLYFARLVLGVQLVLAGIQLPSKYLKTEWKSLCLLLGPGMCCMWIVTALITWGLVPNINILFALCVAACVTPTDPVLSNSIVKGKFADKNIPPKLQRIIIAESGANDGLGYPFLFLALYLIKYTGTHGLGESGGAGKAMALWFYETWAYTILLSIAYGAVVGWIAKELLHWAEERRYVDRESFLVFAITLALFVTGTCGMLGSDDVLACFIAGNVFTWDDWFRLETMDDSFQPTIDMLLNVSVFMWFGAVCPWHKFVANDVVTIYRLIPLSILVLLLRRLPMILSFHKMIHQIEDFRHALFVGFFGPIGVSAIFYLYISREFLRNILVDGHERADASRLAELMDVVVWFLVICSIFVHGLSIPLGKLGFYLPRTISTAVSSEQVSGTQSRARTEDTDEPRTYNLGQRAFNEERNLLNRFRRRATTSGRCSTEQSSTSWMPRTLSRAGKAILGDLNLFPRKNGGQPKDTSSAVDGANQIQISDSSDSYGGHGGARPDISRPTNARLIGRAINNPSIQVDVEEDDADGPRVHAKSPSRSPNRSRAQNQDGNGVGTPTGHAGLGWHRSIRFPDESPSPVLQSNKANPESLNGDP